MQKILRILDEIEDILATIAIEGISEPLIKQLRKQIRRGRRWIIQELRERIGPLSNETRKWVVIAMAIVSTAKGMLLIMGDD